MMSSKKKIVRWAIGVSLALHVVFLTVSSFWWIPGAEAFAEKTRKTFNLRIPRMEPPSTPRRELIQGYARTLKFENPGAAPVSDAAARRTREEEVSAPELQGTEPPDRFAVSRTPEPPDHPAISKEKIAAVPRLRRDEPDATDIFMAADGPVTGDPEAVRVPAGFEEQMPAFTPKSAAPSKTPIGGLFRDIWKKGVQGSGYGTLDRFVDFEVSTWRDPADGRGYFELLIIPGRDAARLESMPKEVILLLDASLSVRGNRIEEFKKGIVYVLKNLNRGDLFNIVTFKDTVTRFSDRAMPADASALGPAIRFMRNMEAGEQTDIYEAFLRNMSARPAIRPSYIVLMSDGRPTLGVTSSARLIEEISRRNKLDRSIFCVGGGRRVNRYLLDFLSYQNRGWSEYAQRETQISRQIARVYDKIRDPLLTNLRYQFGGVEGSDVVPKHLPDFFRGAQFALYGTYGEETEFSVRLLGEIEGRSKEVIFRADLRKAKKGTGELAAAWAFNKIYHLVSRMALEGPDPSALEEIRRLGGKFNIRTPYSYGEN